MLYDLTVLALLPNTLGAVLPILPSTFENFSSTGTPLGCFSCEFGVLNRFAFLTAYEDEDKLAAERARLMKTEDPYGIGAHLGAVHSTAFKPLPFMDEPIVPGEYGPFYEIRTYSIAPGGLPETAEAWSKVVERRQEMSRLLTVMGSVEEGPLQMVHVWPYKTIEDRMKARAQAGKEGIWPPPGGSAHLTALQSELFVATAFSKLK
ncbi:NIPSNAP protein [Faunimonas pinastri]|uniref:NIPSNAP protein n=1 Tax=Faunimonas pinastri TaxID=1855383 RepID=A0A1H9EP36_9HYPH|nr:NIPSNAP family protein [Faunimonas pinastri]SEQ27372.1 NIPSNAP protein [Faunimonas pinastri]